MKVSRATPQQQSSTAFWMEPSCFPDNVHQPDIRRVIARRAHGTGAHHRGHHQGMPIEHKLLKYRFNNDPE